MYVQRSLPREIYSKTIIKKYEMGRGGDQQGSSSPGDVEEFPDDIPERLTPKK